MSSTALPEQPLCIMLALRQDQASHWRCPALAWDVRHAHAHFTQRKKHESNTAGSCCFKFARWPIRLPQGSGLVIRYSVGLSLRVESVFGNRMSDRHDKRRVAMMLSEQGNASVWHVRQEDESCSVKCALMIHIESHLI